MQIRSRAPVCLFQPEWVAVDLMAVGNGELAYLCLGATRRQRTYKLFQLPCQLKNFVGLNGFAVSEDVEFTGEPRRRHCEVRSNLEYAKTRVVVRLLRTSQ